MTEDMLCSTLHVRNLLAKSSPPPLELYVQLLGAGMCASLSRAVLSGGVRNPPPPRRQRGESTDVEPPRRAAASEASVKRPNDSPTSSGAPPQARGLLDARVVDSLQADLSAHYGSHALRRGGAKPLGPAFRGKKALSRGAHAGRAQHIWRMGKARRRWCPRCGLCLIGASAKTSRAASTTLYVGPLPIPQPGHPVRRTASPSSKVKVCALCFRLQSRRAVARLQKEKTCRQTPRVGPVEREMAAPSCSAASRAVLGPRNERVEDIFEEQNRLVAHHLHRITERCKVKQRRRKRTRWSRRAAKKSGSTIKKTISTSDGPTKTTSIIEKAPSTSASAPRQKLNFDIPKGPARRGGAKSKPTPAPEPLRKQKPLQPQGETPPHHNKTPVSEVAKAHPINKGVHLKQEKLKHPPQRGALASASPSAIQSVLEPSSKNKQAGRPRGEVKSNSRAPAPAQQSGKRVLDMMAKLGF